MNYTFPFLFINMLRIVFAPLVGMKVKVKLWFSAPIAGIAEIAKG